jgi:hypothetical protein
LRPSWASEITSRAPFSPRRTSPLRKVDQKVSASEGPRPRPPRASADARSSGDGLGRHRDDPSAVADLEVGRVEPEIGPIALQGPLQERVHPLVPPHAAGRMGTPASISLPSWLTVLLAMPASPIDAQGIDPCPQGRRPAGRRRAWTRSSTRRVAIPAIRSAAQPWITATNAFSLILRGSRKGGT